NIQAALLTPANATKKLPELDLNDFRSHPGHYTIVDARNANETEDGLVFDHACTIPLPELRERVNEIPTDKPIVAHCAAGYRSAAASSIIRGKITNVPVYDLGEDVKELVNEPAGKPV
ncbi:MAG: MBL fold metallo-hydrolase, partial [Bacteroidota bacterium]|nr:MBL fold metallo-hydrolase [Bacteroidota bacterium]